MTYKEMVAYVRKMMAENKPLHGYAREIAIEILLQEEENSSREK